MQSRISIMKKTLSRIIVAAACTLAITAVTLKPITVNNASVTNKRPGYAATYGLPSKSSPIIYN